MKSAREEFFEYINDLMSTSLSATKTGKVKALGELMRQEAITQERERCAQVVEQSEEPDCSGRTDYYGEQFTYFFDEAYSHAAERIRTGAEPNIEPLKFERDAIGMRIIEMLPLPTWEGPFIHRSIEERYYDLDASTFRVFSPEIDWNNGATQGYRFGAKFGEDFIYDLLDWFHVDKLIRAKMVSSSQRSIPSLFP